MRYYKSKYGADYNTNSFMTIARTGKAAFLSNGNTICNTLHLQASQSFAQYRSLDAESRNTLRSHIRHVKVWLIDEVSMVGNRMLAFIDQRLQKVHSTNQIFGGYSVIAFGDFFQLPLGMDGSIFEDQC
jgi:hypothetical protein